MISTDITLVIQAVDKATAQLEAVNKRLDALEKAQEQVAATAKTLSAAQEKAAAATTKAAQQTAKGTEELKQFAIKGTAVVTMLKRIVSGSESLSGALSSSSEAIGLYIDKLVDSLGGTGSAFALATAVPFEKAMMMQDAIGKLWEQSDAKLQSATGEERKRLAAITEELSEQYDQLGDLQKAYSILGAETPWPTLQAAAKALTAARKDEKQAADELTKSKVLLATESKRLASAEDEEGASAVERANKLRADLERVKSAIGKAAMPSAGIPATEREALKQMAVALRQEIESLEMLHSLSLLIGSSSTPEMERAIAAASKTLNENAEAARKNARGYDEIVAAIDKVPAEVKVDIKIEKNDIPKLEKALITVGEIADRIGSGFADAFMSIIDGSKSAADAFRQMAASILADVARMLVSRSIANVISSAFGGPTAKAFQHGGAVVAGAPVLVGERGPELFVPGQSGYVNNAGASRGGGGVTVNFQISAVDGPSVQAMLVREADTIKALISRAAASDHRFRAGLA